MSVSSTAITRSQTAVTKIFTKQLSLPFIVLITFTLAVFSGMRFKVGSDYSMYAYFYEIVDPTSLRNSLAIIPQEPGFVILMMACRRISDDPRLLFTQCSAAIDCGIVDAIWRVFSRQL